MGLASIVLLMRSLVDYKRLPSLFRPVSTSVMVAAGLALLLGWWAPPPWLLALSVFSLLTVNWLWAVSLWYRLPDPDLAFPNHPHNV